MKVFLGGGGGGDLLGLSDPCLDKLSASGLMAAFEGFSIDGFADFSIRGFGSFSNPFLEGLPNRSSSVMQISKIV